MIDPTNGAPAPGPAPSQPAAGAAPFSLTVNAQYIKDFSFENPRAPQVYLQPPQPPQVQVNVDVRAQPVAENVFEVVLNLAADAKSGNDAIFVVELSYAGLFSVPALPQEQLRPLLLIECPRLLFPFARAIIADATRDGGFSPLMIGPIDFVELFRRQAAQRATGAGGAGQAQA